MLRTFCSAARLTRYCGIGVLMAAAATHIATPAQSAEFRWASSQDAVTLDPHSINQSFVLGFIGNVYEPLVRRDANFELEPALATSWSQVDEKTWRFKLRPGVKFQNGNDFDADDVVFSLARAKKAGIKNMVATIAEAKKVDRYTVDFITKGADPILPREITNWYMVDNDWATKNNAADPAQANAEEENYAGRNAMGTGPFQVTSRETGVKTVMEPNPGWWDKSNHNLTKVTFTRIANAATRVAALRSGDIDMVHSVPPQDVARIEADENLNVISGPELRTMFVMLDVSRDELLESDVKGKNPFKALKVRLAIQHAVDEEAIKKKIMRSFAVPVGAIMGKEINGYHPDMDNRYPFDLQKAKGLMEEAGYGDGFSVTLDCTNDRFIQDEAICIALAGMLSKINIRVNARIQTVGKWAKQINPPTYNTSFVLVGYSPSTTDAHNVLNTLVTSRNKEAGRGIFNVGGYTNKRVDELTLAIQEEQDQAKRNEMIREAFQLINDDAVFVPLHQQVILWAAKKNVDLVQLPDNRLNLWLVRVN